MGYYIYEDNFTRWIQGYYIRGQSNSQNVGILSMRIFLLAQMPILQALVSVVFPAHGCPPSEGVGLSQLRIRVSTPDPQVLLQ